MSYLESGTSRPRLRVLLGLADSELSSLSSFSAFSSGLYIDKIDTRSCYKVVVGMVCLGDEW